MLNNFVEYDFRVPVGQRRIQPEPVIKNHHDWKIHKILDETRRVYIYPARGNNKIYTQLELYAELMDHGKEITFVRSADLPKKDPWKVYKELLNLDKDFICNSESPWLQNAIDKYFEEEMKKYLRKYIENWKPKVWIDTCVIDDKLWYERMLWNHLVFGNTFVVKED